MDLNNMRTPLNSITTDHSMINSINAPMGSNSMNAMGGNSMNAAPISSDHQAATAPGRHQQLNAPYPGIHINVSEDMPGDQPNQMPPQSPDTRHINFSMPGGPDPHQGGPPQGGYSSHAPLHSPAQQSMHPNMPRRMRSSGLNGNWQTGRDTPRRRRMIQHM